MTQRTVAQPPVAAKIKLPRLALLAALLLIVGLGIWIAVAQVAVGSHQAAPDGAQLVFEAQTGVRITRVALTAGDGLADIHYQVLDPDKALAVHDRERPPTLVHQKSGVVLNTPFHGHGFRELHTGITYRLHIWNTGSALQRGDRVMVRIGETSLEDVLVQ